VSTLGGGQGALEAGAHEGREQRGHGHPSAGIVHAQGQAGARARGGPLWPWGPPLAVVTHLSKSSPTTVSGTISLYLPTTSSSLCPTAHVRAKHSSSYLGLERSCSRDEEQDICRTRNGSTPLLL